MRLIRFREHRYQSLLAPNVSLVLGIQRVVASRMLIAVGCRFQVWFQWVQNHRSIRSNAYEQGHCGYSGCSDIMAVDGAYQKRG